MALIFSIFLWPPEPLLQYPFLRAQLCVPDFDPKSAFSGPTWVQIRSKFSGLQKGPAERGHVKKRQKSSKSVKKFSTLFDNFRAGQKTSKIFNFLTIFDVF